MKIALLGYGKMGKEIEQIALSKGHEIVLKITSKNISDFKKENLQKADVAIEFSNPNSVVENVLKCFEASVPIVAGTTGWDDKESEIKALCKEKNQTLFFASNFSIGVNLFFELNKTLAQLMNKHNEYKVSIEEIHHVHKKDSPSGTAITLANQLIENSDKLKKWINKESENKEDLGVVSLRKDEVPGTHSIKYWNEIDEIEIIHKAHSRKGFAAGAVIAAEFIKGKKGIFGMKDILTLK